MNHHNKKALLGALGMNPGDDGEDWGASNPPSDLSAPDPTGAATHWKNPGADWTKDPNTFSFTPKPPSDHGVGTTPKVALPNPSGTAGAPPVPPLGPATAPPLAMNFGSLQGYDKTKFNDPNKQSAKYQMGRILSQFDPKLGITPEVLAALNGLGFGGFSGSGDKLSLKGLTAAGKSAGLVGDYTDADFNVGYKTGNGKWGYQDPAYEAINPQTGVPVGGVGGGGINSGLAGAQSNLNGLMKGDFQAAIQAALAQMTDKPNLQALLAQLGGG